MIGQQQVYDRLQELGIEFTYTEHPPTPTIDDGRPYWGDLPGTHCKNLFFRNHKGNRHYLIVFQCDHDIALHDLEHVLHQGKLSLASEWRMDKYLGLKAGSVSPFGLINDVEHHVHLFLDEKLKNADALSFHPNDCRGTVVIRRTDFEHYLDSLGNTYEYLELRK